MAEKNRAAALRRGRVQQGLTESEYARHLGISQPAVNIAKRAGKLALFSDGSIDQERSDEKYFEMTDLEQSERGRAQAGPRANHYNQLNRMKTLHTAVATQVARERLAKMRGEVVDRDTAQRIVFQMARQERDQWLGWPARVAPLLAAELAPPGGTALDIHTVQVLLEAHVHAQLSALPPLAEDPFPAPVLDDTDTIEEL